MSFGKCKKSIDYCRRLCVWGVFVGWVYRDRWKDGFHLPEMYAICRIFAGIFNRDIDCILDSGGIGMDDEKDAGAAKIVVKHKKEIT